jgi:hypothetical protein
MGSPRDVAAAASAQGLLDDQTMQSEVDFETEEGTVTRRTLRVAIVGVAEERPIHVSPAIVVAHWRELSPATFDHACQAAFDQR